MTTNKKVFLIIAIALSIIFVLCISWLIYDEFIATYDEYIIPYWMVEPLFGCDVDSFATEELDIYNEVNGFNSRSHIDKNGDLVIQLTKHQTRELLESKWIDPGIDVSNNQYNFEISKDNKVLTLYITSEDIKNKEKLRAMAVEGYSIWWKMYITQQTVEQPEPVITLRTVNSDTGETLEEVIP